MGNLNSIGLIKTNSCNIKSKSFVFPLLLQTFSQCFKISPVCNIAFVVGRNQFYGHWKNHTLGKSLEHYPSCLWPCKIALQLPSFSGRSVLGVFRLLGALPGSLFSYLWTVWGSDTGVAGQQTRAKAKRCLKHFLQGLVEFEQGLRIQCKILHSIRGHNIPYNGPLLLNVLTFITVFNIFSACMDEIESDN